MVRRVLTLTRLSAPRRVVPPGAGLDEVVMLTISLDETEEAFAAMNHGKSLGMVNQVRRD